jgi:hypothetical protein
MSDLLGSSFYAGLAGRNADQAHANLQAMRELDAGKGRQFEKPDALFKDLDIIAQKRFSTGPVAYVKDR